MTSNVFVNLEGTQQPHTLPITKYIRGTNYKIPPTQHLTDTGNSFLLSYMYMSALDTIIFSTLEL